MSRLRAGAARAMSCAALVCLLAAPVASSYPDEFGPFEGRRPRVVRTFPCRRAGPYAGGDAVTYSRAAEGGGPSVRLERSATGGHTGRCPRRRSA